MRAVVVVGTGRYADPWHPFAANARCVADLLTADGWQVVLDTDVDGAMTRLDDADLLVVCAGDPWGRGERSFTAPRASIEGLARARGRGLGVLGLHAAAASLRDYPCWAPMLGGVWVPQASMHPPFGAARITVHSHPLTDGIEDFDVLDERYCFLQPVGQRTTLASHTLDGHEHPLVWLSTSGTQRVAYDALGHDPRSYDSPEHVLLLQRLARWAAHRGAPAPHTSSR